MEDGTGKRRSETEMDLAQILNPLHSYMYVYTYKWRIVCRATAESASLLLQS